MKDYPAFIIDRSRRSEASRYTDDFVVCTDREVGFIARVFILPKSRRQEFEQGLKVLEDEEINNRYCFAVVNESMCVLEVIRMLYEPVAHINRLHPLMKKAMKAYLHGEISAVKRDCSSYDDQITALDEVLRMSESQKNRMIDLNGEIATERFICGIRSARESVALLQKIVKS